MKSIAATVDISLRPEEVFWYVTDASRFPEWQGNVVSAHWEGNTPVRVGPWPPSPGASVPGHCRPPRR